MVAALGTQEWEEALRRVARDTLFGLHCYFKRQCYTQEKKR